MKGKKATALRFVLALANAAALIISCGGASAQVLKGSAVQKRVNDLGMNNSALLSNKTVQQAVAHAVQIGPGASVPGGDGSHSAIIAILKRQSAAARSLVLPAGRPPNPSHTLSGTSGGASGNGALLNPGTTSGLNPQPIPPKGSQPMLGASQTMSAPGTQSTGASTTPTATQVSPLSGRTPHQAPGGRQPQTQATGARAPIPTQMCRAGIATVDGAANGVWFSPVPGDDGKFVIDGCGFGSMPGQVYLSGVQYDASHANMAVQPIRISTCAGCVYFTIPPNQWKNSQQFTTSWSDRQIVAQIDPNASGLYDTNNVTLNVKTAGGQIYQARGMNFLAARADQVLSWIVKPPTGYAAFVGHTSFISSATSVIRLMTVSDSTGNQIVPGSESPSESVIWSGESFDAVRARFDVSTLAKVTFPGGTDTYQLSLGPGFQLDPQSGVEMRHTEIDVDQCRRSFNGSYGWNGNWGINYTSGTSFQISWQEQECWPKTGAQGASPLDYGSVSAYALQITVLGPRGVSPWASGSVGGLGTKQMQPAQLLKKQ